MFEAETTALRQYLARCLNCPDNNPRALSKRIDQLLAAERERDLLRIEVNDLREKLRMKNLTK